MNPQIAVDAPESLPSGPFTSLADRKMWQAVLRYAGPNAFRLGADVVFRARDRPLLRFGAAFSSLLNAKLLAKAPCRQGARWVRGLGPDCKGHAVIGKTWGTSSSARESKELYGK